MAGVGEASAIIAVAQLGLTLASTLASFIGDYREAGNRMNNLSDEIQITSASLQQLGDLAKRNRLHGERGVLEATNLTERCRLVIFEIRTILKKGDRPLNPSAIDKAEIELSCYKRLKWTTYLKSRLEIPRLELSRLKTDLMLTFLSMIALGGENQQERKQASDEIPGLRSTLRWANGKYEEAVRRRGLATYVEPPPTYSPPGDNLPRGLNPSRQSSAVQDENDPEKFKEFAEFKEKQIAEQRKKGEMEALQLRELEERQQREEEERRNKEIADKAIAEYELQKQRENDEADRRNSQMLDEFRKYLEGASVQEQEIDRIINRIPNSSNALVPFQQTPESPERAQPAEADENLMVVSRRAKPSLSQRYYGYPRKPTTSSDRASVTSQERITESQDFHPVQDPCKLEAWSIDQLTQHRFQIPISHPWLANHLSQQEKTKDINVMWQRYSKLHSWYKKEIDDIFENKRRDRKYSWSLVCLEKIKQRRRAGFLKPAEEQICLQVILKGTRKPRRTGGDLDYGLGPDFPGGPHSGGLRGPRNGSDGSGSDGEPDGTHRPQSPLQHNGEPVQAQNIGELPMAPQNQDGTSSKDGGDMQDPSTKDNRVVIVESDTGPYPRVRSLLPKKLVDIQAAIDYGYDFHEQGDNIVIHSALTKKSVEDLVVLSEGIREADGAKTDANSLLVHVDEQTPRQSRNVRFAPGEPESRPPHSLDYQIDKFEERGYGPLDIERKHDKDWAISRRGDFTVARRPPRRRPTFDYYDDRPVGRCDLPRRQDSRKNDYGLDLGRNSTPYSAHRRITDRDSSTAGYRPPPPPLPLTYHPSPGYGPTYDSGNGVRYELPLQAPATQPNAKPRSFERPRDRSSMFGEIDIIHESRYDRGRRNARDRSPPVFPHEDYGRTSAGSPVFAPRYHERQASIVRCEPKVADLRRERELERERDRRAGEHVKDLRRVGDDITRRERELDNRDRARKPLILEPSGTRLRNSRLGNIDEDFIIHRDDPDYERDYERDEIVIRGDNHQRGDRDFDREEIIIRHRSPPVLSETSSDDERDGGYLLDVNGSSSKRHAMVEDPAEALSKQLALYTQPQSSVSAAATSVNQDSSAKPSKTPYHASFADEDSIHEEPEVYYDGGGNTVKNDAEDPRVCTQPPSVTSDIDQGELDPKNEQVIMDLYD